MQCPSLLTCESSYRVCHFEYGVIVKGELPFFDFFDLKRFFFMRYGYTYNDVAIAKYFKATLCLTTPFGSNKWRKVISLFMDITGESMPLSDSDYQTLTFKNRKIRKPEESAYLRGRANTL